MRGRCRSRTSLLADWGWTDNALEKMAFLAKDLPFVIDEFAPVADRAEARRLEVKVTRLLRAQGNLAGRGRMRADSSLRSPYPPRGLLMATAEMPPGPTDDTAVSLLRRSLRILTTSVSFGVAPSM